MIKKNKKVFLINIGKWNPIIMLISIREIICKIMNNIIQKKKYFSKSNKL